MERQATKRSLEQPTLRMVMNIRGLLILSQILLELILGSFYLCPNFTDKETEALRS